MESLVGILAVHWDHEPPVCLTLTRNLTLTLLSSIKSRSKSEIKSKKSSAKSESSVTPGSWKASTPLARVANLTFPVSIAVYAASFAMFLSAATCRPLLSLSPRAKATAKIAQAPWPGGRHSLLSASLRRSCHKSRCGRTTHCRPWKIQSRLRTIPALRQAKSQRLNPPRRKHRQPFRNPRRSPARICPAHCAKTCRRR